VIACISPPSVVLFSSTSPTGSSSHLLPAHLFSGVVMSSALPGCSSLRGLSPSHLPP
jgi:hypothetical protein